MKFFLILLVYFQMAYGTLAKKSTSNDFDAIFFENVNYKGIFFSSSWFVTNVTNPDKEKKIQMYFLRKLFWS